MGAFTPGCCCGNCDIFEDAFTRADDTNIGSDWSEASGAWEIASSRLKATSNGIAVYNTTLAPATYSVVSIVRSSTSGDQLGVVGYYADTSNYYSVILTIGTGATLKIFKTSGGTTTELGTKSVTAAIDTDHTVTLCISTSGSFTRLTAGVSGTASYLTRVVTSGPLSGPGKAGVFRKSASGTTVFDDFSVNESEGDCPACPLECSCSGDVPSQIQVTISIAGFCSALSGTYTLNHANRCIGDTCSWSYFFSPSGPCAVSHLKVAHNGSGGIGVTTYGADPCLSTSGQLTWTGTGFSSDCTAWSSESIPFSSGTCCGASPDPTCTVTAL